MGKKSLQRDVLSYVQNLVCEEITVTHKTVIEKLDKQAKGIYIIKKGILKYVIPVSKNKITISFEGPGSIIGLNSIFQLPNPFSVVAVTKATLEFIPVEVLQHPVNNNLREPSIFSTMCYEKITRLKQKIYWLYSMDATQRVVLSLFELCQLNGNNHTGAITKKEISEFAGCSIEYTHRSLAQLQRQNLIQMDKRDILINNKKALQELIDKK